MLQLTIPTNSEIKAYFPHIRICLVKVFYVLVYCVLKRNTVNLNICKKYMGEALGQKGINTDSAYRRLTRFFTMRTPRMFCIGISYLIINILCNSGQSGFYWAIDRTNWQIGKKNKVNCNVLALGLVLNNGCFIPIIGLLLNKKGNSNERERINLINDFCKFFFSCLPEKLRAEQHIFLGDREFIGEKWFEHLVAKGFSLVMRLRKDDYLHQLAIAQNTTVYKIKRKIKHRVKRDGFFYSPICINNIDLVYVVLPNSNPKAEKKDHLVRFISDLTNLKQISDAYCQRWQIEVYFKHCKTNGFNLEDLNLKKDDKMLLMTAIVGFAYVLAIVQGLLRMQQKPVKKQYFANQDKYYLRKSIFKQGMDQITINVFNLFDLLELIKAHIPDKPLFNKQAWVHGLINEYTNNNKQLSKSVQ